MGQEDWSVIIGNSHSLALHPITFITLHKDHALVVYLCLCNEISEHWRENYWSRESWKLPNLQSLNSFQLVLMIEKEVVFFSGVGWVGVWVISYTAQLLVLGNHKYGGLNAPNYRHLKIKWIIGNANQCAKAFTRCSQYMVHSHDFDAFIFMHAWARYTHKKIIFFIITL